MTSDCTIAGKAGKEYLRHSVHPKLGVDMKWDKIPK
jgi:hypothetical protein